MSHVALCPSCRDVLVSTFAWRGKEFVCLSCGSLWEWLQPNGADETPELLERIEATKTEWRALQDGLLPAGAMLTACRDAGGGCASGQTHRLHATEAEIAAHEAAVARIGERLGRTVA